MKLYCLVETKINENGEEYKHIAEGPIELPLNTSSISNLRALDEESLKNLGWLPYIKQTEDKPVYVSSSYRFTSSEVIEEIITRDKTEAELIEEKTKRDYYEWQTIRQRRNDLLAESDKLVTSDRWEKLSVEEKDKLSQYRQQLRDLPDQNSDPILVVFPAL
jgi:hypothetical protein